VPFALAAACGAAFLFVAQPASDSPSYSSSLQPQAAAPLGDVATRGGAPDTSPVGVRVRCVDGDRVFDDAVAGARVRGDDLECSTVGLLAFSTTNLARADRYALVVGVDGDGRRVWLEPFAHGTPARVLSAGSIDVVVDRLVPMSVLPDDVTLHVLVSDRPFSSEEIERRLVAAERSAVPLAQLDRLPVDVSLQSHLSLHRVP
jgi:hypothetical protein